MTKKKDIKGIAGRPRKEINWDLVELYLKAGSNQQKICKTLGICTETMAKYTRERYGCDFSELSDRLRSEGDILIEAQQYQKAMKGYWPALLWLGKVRLGQTEPESALLEAANQNDIDQTHRIMELQHELSKYREPEYADVPDSTSKDCLLVDG